MNEFEQIQRIDRHLIPNQGVVPLHSRPEGPQPLLREIPRGDEYPVGSLGPLQDVVKAIHRTTQAPVAIAAQSALSVASLAVQSHADVETLAGPAPSSLFCLTVAQSGERKSACDKRLMRGVRSFERDQAVQFSEDFNAWKTSQKLWSTKHDRLVKEAAGKDPSKALSAQADLEAMGAEPEAPLSPKLTTTEPTLEGLFKLYQVGQPGLGLFSDEAGGFLGGHAMNSDNRLKTVAGLSSLWGGEPIDRVRSGDGASTLYGRRLAIHLMVQPIAARPLLSDPVASGQGFLARFLITEPPSAIGTRLARTSDHVADVAEVAAEHRLTSILNEAKPVAEHDDRELDPRVLPLSKGAKELLYRYYVETEKAQGPGGKLEHVKSFASKSPEQAARLAGVLTLWENLSAPKVTTDVMADAITLAQFYLFEAKRLAEAATVSADIEAAEQLRLWILDSWPGIALKQSRSPETILPRDVVMFGPNSLRETVRVKKLMGILEDHLWLQRLESGAEVDGVTRGLAYRICRED